MGLTVIAVANPSAVEQIMTEHHRAASDVDDANAAAPAREDQALIARKLQPTIVAQALTSDGPVGAREKVRIISARAMRGYWFAA